MIIFNVDYRNAPEAKAPKGILDCYAACKYVIEKANEYNIDTSRLAIIGESGGGYMAAGVAMELAKKNESHLVKVVIVDLPMVFSGWVR